MKKKVLLAPLDPVHDVGLKMIRRGLRDAGHETVLLAPDLAAGEIIQAAFRHGVDIILVSRTLGYGVAEILAGFIDLADAAGLRDSVRIAVGGMAVTRELAAELGFDGGFGPGTTVEEATAFVEGREFLPAAERAVKSKRDLTAGYSYRFRHAKIARLLEGVVDGYLAWMDGKTSPGAARAALRDEFWQVEPWLAGARQDAFYRRYPEYCGGLAREYWATGKLHPKTRVLTGRERETMENQVRDIRIQAPQLQHARPGPAVLTQYGTGCPLMDVAHIKVVEAWGADGVVHFDPSWGARTEGLMEGFLTHQEDGTVITPENLHRIKQSLEPSTIWQVRAHRGLNTAETVVLAGKLGAELTKINIAYGALGGGTDPARLAVDAYHAVRYAAKYNLAFDVVTNEELCGVPAYKAFAGMLITAAIALRLGARPILQPLFCYSPEVMISGQMEDNYVNYNLAKVRVLREIIEAPVWPGAPIGFLTHTEDRVQSAVTTALHAMLAASLDVDAVTIASSDEAYAGGPITAASRVDTLRATREAFRFLGRAAIQPGNLAEFWQHRLLAGIEQVLEDVLAAGGFVNAMYQGMLGSREDGAYPGRAGTGTVRERDREADGSC